MSSSVTLGMLLKPSGLQNNLYHSQQQPQLGSMDVRGSEVWDGQSRSLPLSR